ncbi:hypothetical protein TRAPUB_2278 [Trametes pubescens]|uniref:Uncharacterized protein n=1 Tax=Trametes pubescens TaxID=154538 RepID=A0A1M2VH11_TRAPU|nr:hypothetical protein TRAPUB_2278 [Trametes pubescens]
MSQVSLNSNPIAPALPSLGDLEGNSLVEASKLLADEDSAGLGAYNAPIAIMENSSQIWGHLPTDATPRYIRYAQEGRHFVMGPMPPRDFLDTFCNCPDVVMKDMPCTDNAFAKVPSSAGAERAIYEPLFRDTSLDPDSKGSATFKPDIICYSNKHLNHVVVDKPSPSSLRSRTDMGFATFFFEVKKAPADDFFKDPPPGSSHGHNLQKKKKMEKEYGQNISYTTEVFA